MATKQELKVYEDTDKNLKVRAVVLKAGEVSDATNRIYPREVVEKAVEDFNKKPRPAIGFLLEAGAESLQERPNNIAQATHIVENVQVTDGGEVIADIKILEESPRGKLLAGMLRAGCAFNSSICGFGSLDEDNKVSEYELESVDLCIQRKEMELVKIADKMTEQELEDLKLRGKGHKRVLRIEK